MSTRRVIISRHVIFDESVFLFSTAPSAASVQSSLDFLMQGLSSQPASASTAWLLVVPTVAAPLDESPDIHDLAIL
jgi:hypothetical protein